MGFPCSHSFCQLTVKPPRVLKVQDFDDHWWLEVPRVVVLASVVKRGQFYAKVSGGVRCGSTCPFDTDALKRSIDLESGEYDNG